MTAQSKPNVVYIGPESIGNALAEMRPEWSFSSSVERINDFRIGLVDGSIDSNIQVLLIVDKLFDMSSRDSSFEKLIASLSPYCLVGAISYSPSVRGEIRDRVWSEALVNALGEGDFYFIDAKLPAPDLDSAVEDFCLNPPSGAKATAELLSEARTLRIDEDLDLIAPDPASVEVVSGPRGELSLKITGANSVSIVLKDQEIRVKGGESDSEAPLQEL